MGFFSSKCKCCGLEILSPYSVDKKTAWLNQAVAIDTFGEASIGQYDGYGKINETMC
jgi:hypothetical protein